MKGIRRSGSSATLAVEIGRTHIRAVEAARRGDRIRINHTVVEKIPRDLDTERDAEFGEWLGGTLRKAGITSSRATFAVSREHISLKRMSLPTTDVFELPEMARLAMQRELPFDPSEAVIDFIPITSSETHTVVLVAAIKQDTLRRLEHIARAARLSIARVGLRCSGVETLLATVRGDAADDASAILGVDVTSGAIEFSVLTEGRIRFSRAAEIAEPGTSESFLESVITETRRSWMSYRIVEDAPPISASWLLGDEAVVKTAAERTGELMTVRSTALTEHPSIEVEQPLETCWPLAGCLLEEVIGRDRFDFIDPRQAPDRHARTRQMALAAVGAVVVILAGLGAMAFKHLGGLENRSSELAERIKDGTADFHRAKRDQARLQHLEHWDATTVDWLAHIAMVQDRLPDVDQMVLDKWSGSLSYRGIEYDARARRTADQWRVPASISMILDGEAADQEIVDQFRAAFANSKEYTISPTGPDTQGGQRYPYPFKVTLRTATLRPEVDPDKTANTGDRHEKTRGDDEEVASKGGTESEESS